MEKREIKAFIFDLDGVLLSTDEYHYRAWKTVADEIGVPFDRKTNDRLRGVSREASLDIILESGGVRLTDEEKRKTADKKNAIYKAMLEKLDKTAVSDDIREMLERLRKAGYKLAVGSSSRNARLILEKTELTGAFDAVADGTEIKRTKPDPEVFLLAARKLQTEPEQCAVVEDAPAGITAAKKAGMYAVGINTPADQTLSTAADVGSVVTRH